MGNIWYICKYCNRALTSSHLLKVHKLRYHVPELRQLKRAKLEAAALLLQNKSIQEEEDETIRNEDPDEEETEPPQSSTIKDALRTGDDNTSENIFETSLSCANPTPTHSSATKPKPGGATPGQSSTSEIVQFEVECESAEEDEDDDTGEVVTNDKEWTALDTNRDDDAEDSGRSVPISPLLSPDEEVHTISQHFHFSGSEREPDSISIETQGHDQLELVQTVSNSEKPEQHESSSLGRLGSYVDELFQRYQLEEHFYHDDQTLTYTCCYCPIGYKYFKRGLNHALTHPDILRSKNCLEKLRECLREYSSVAQPRLSSSATRIAEVQPRNSATNSRSFKCPKCGKRFSLQLGLKFHMRQQHWSTADTLNQGHIQKSTTNQNLTSAPEIMENVEGFQCRAPGPGVLASQRYDRDLMRVQGHSLQRIPNIQHAPNRVRVAGRTYACPKCQEKFKRKAHLNLHLQEHRRNMEKYRCRDCCATFETVAKRTQHRRREHSLKCKICEKVFCNSSTFQRHTLDAHMNSAHTCEYCEKMFLTDWALSYHLKMHLKKEVALQRAAQRLANFPCSSPECSESSNTENNLNQQVTSTYTPSSRASVLESDAGSIITQNEAQVTENSNDDDDGSLGLQEITYAQTHWKKAVLVREEEPYPCASEEVTRVVHRCRECNQSFKDTVELEIHAQSHSGFAIQLAYCTFCGQMISTATGLEAHIEMHRVGILECACHQCHLVYSSISKFNHHMLTTHKRQDA